MAEPKSIHVVGDYLDYERAIKILEEKNLKYHTMRDAYADIAFTTQAVRNLARYSKKTIKINLQYGCSLLKNAFGASEVLPDLIIRCLMDSLTVNYAVGILIRTEHMILAILSIMTLQVTI